MTPIDFQSWLQLDHWFNPEPGPMSAYYYYILAAATAVLLGSVFVYGFYAERRWPDHYFKRRLARSIAMATITISILANMMITNRQMGLPYLSMRVWSLALLLSSLVVVAYYIYYLIWRYSGDMERWEAGQGRAELRGQRSARRRLRRRR